MPQNPKLKLKNKYSTELKTILGRGLHYARRYGRRFIDGVREKTEAKHKF